MFVTPAPVGLLIVFLQPGKVAIFAMVLFGVNAIRLILMIVPFMVVIVFLVVIAARGLIGYCRYWRQKSGAQQSRVEKTGSDCSHATTKSNRMATMAGTSLRCAGCLQFIQLLDHSRPFHTVALGGNRRAQVCVVRQNIQPELGGDVCVVAMQFIQQ